MKKAKFSLIIVCMLLMGQFTACSEAEKEATSDNKEATTKAESENTTKEEGEKASPEAVEVPEEEEEEAKPKKKKEEASILGATSKNDIAQEGEPKMEFAEKEFNFGEVIQKDVVEHTFEFKNAGDAPLVISNARASCGCTVPEWPKDPIAPGESGKIEVKFNTRGKSGVQNKSVTITHNGGTDVVYVKGVVKLPESK